ncbi:MAG: hemolysin family protein [Treponema sp.]|nr:hemolysin family protein [Treponema sp.]
MNSGDPLIWQLLLLVLLILTSGFFSCAEISLISINRIKLEKAAAAGQKTKTGRQAQRILSLTGQPSKFLATVQVGSILAGFMASAYAASTISARLSSALAALGTPVPVQTLVAFSTILITLMLTFVQIVLGELVPKRLAMKYADTLAFPLSFSIVIASRIFAPLVWLLSRSANGILRLLGVRAEGEASAVTEEDIRLMIDAGSAKGTIPSGEKEILHNVFEFDNKSAAEVMTHRRDAVLLKLEDDDQDWEKTITESRHSHFPVYGKTPDDIVGVLKSRDYLCLKDRSRQNVLAHAVSPAQLVPTTVRTNVLFARMKKNRNHFAVVLDEHGGMMGIVTMKDLLEELVGNLDDDSSSPPEAPLIQRTGQDSWTLNGAISLDKAAQELEVSLPLERYDTFAGYVFSILGRIPDDGSQEHIETQDLKISILDIRERRLEKAHVTRKTDNE